MRGLSGFWIWLAVSSYGLLWAAAWQAAFMLTLAAAAGWLVGTVLEERRKRRERKMLHALKRCVDVSLALASRGRSKPSVDPVRWPNYAIGYAAQKGESHPSFLVYGPLNKRIFTSDWMIDADERRRVENYRWI